MKGLPKEPFNLGLHCLQRSYTFIFEIDWVNCSKLFAHTILITYSMLTINIQTG